MSVSPFSFDNYLNFLEKIISSRKDERGFQGKLAAAAGIHGSYLSRVLSREVHLTPEHALGIADFLGLPRDAADDLLLLVQMGRAGTSALKKNFQRQREQNHKQREQMIARLDNATNATGASFELYYTLWYVSAVHMLLMISEMNETRKISERLGIGVAEVRRAIELLISLGIAKKDGLKVSIVETDLHLPKDQIWEKIYQANWRHRAAQRALQPAPEDMQFAALHVISKADFLIVKEILRDALTKIRHVAAPSKEEEIYYIGIDGFKV